MVAFLADTRGRVRTAYQTALANGGISEEAPDPGRSITPTTMAVTSGIRMETSSVSRASGPLVAGRTVTWHWDHCDATGDVFVGAIEANRRIEIEWPSPVEIVFEPRSVGATFVSIAASGFSGTDDEKLAQAFDSTEGFNLVLAGCKAYLEHAIELKLVADQNPDGSVQ